MRRISRGTPYVLTEADIENVLGSLTPRVETAIAALMDMSVEAWRKQTKAVKVKQIVDFQNRGQMAATLAAAARAHTDLEESALAVTTTAEADSLRDEVAALRDLVHDLANRPAAKKRGA